MVCSQCGNKYQTEASVCQKCATTPIWNPNATANWSLLFTPAFGSYLQMLNWRALGEPENSAASKKWFYASLGMLAVFVLLGVFMGDSQNASGAARGLGFGYLMGWYFSSGRQQSKYVKAKLGAEYVRRPWTKPLLIGVGGTVAYSMAAFAVGFLIAIAKGI